MSRCQGVANPRVEAAACRAALGPDPGDPRPLHQALPGYAPTPLHELPGLARELGVGALWAKDEGQRFGLQAFKALGASYAVYRLLAEAAGGDLPPETLADPARLKGLGPAGFAAATDGNHGRALAWVARQLGRPARIYIPADAAPARVSHLEAEGAEVVLVDGPYDQAVARCAAEAPAAGLQVVADTGYEGYTEIPGWIAAGYATLFQEVAEAGAEPDLVLVPCGVGALAEAAARAYRARDPGPRLVCVEPTGAACALESIQAGARVQASGSLETIMAGLNCGTPSLTAWGALETGFDAFLAVDDAWACEAMTRLARPAPGDPAITAGESGAASLAGLLALLQAPELATLRASLGLGPETRALLLVTEGATDPAGWEAVVGEPLEDAP